MASTPTNPSPEEPSDAPGAPAARGTVGSAAQAKNQLAKKVLRRSKNAVRRAEEQRKGWRRSLRRSKRFREDYWKFLRKEFRWETSFRQRQPLWWGRGFLSRSATLYNLEQNDPGDYVSDVQRYTRTRHMVHPHLQDVLHNKFTFFLLMSQLGLDSDTVPLLGVHYRGDVHVFPGDEQIPLADFLREHLDVGQKVFVKPFRGAEGKNVRAVRRTGEDSFVMDGEPASFEQVHDWLAGRPRPMAIETAVAQAPAQAALNPEATNTIRVLTMPDITRGKEPFIVIAVQRIATAKSNHVDNWTRGGLSAEIDLETGKLGKASRLPDGRELEWFSVHPDVGSQIEGAQVPFWEETKALVLEAAQRLNFLEYIGWDIIISPTGPVILEGNVNSGMNVLQVHRPLLTDPRVRRYFEKRGVV
ncbi:sugar-transfer associated ATP-grasp domain-containing protein [Nesterenkonia aerolata]|uniref:Sugar-transfer associated ATP-grasp domain-containing protein n=1 Tax=Nesterenkonia aerolata TaxID=3074079 RepID=A0ABU2DR87_9MICC|nr:sugar-transfer associated ATP-grasp domain-containing protein [Nesterenkonia sp. LY-0111]MDR8018911.1 sugar-transfer associated ATP-grasp domain-containing protein [Nesterenkonia sp. LY-0111]